MLVVPMRRESCVGGPEERGVMCWWFRGGECHVLVVPSRGVSCVGGPDEESVMCWWSR